MQHSSLHTPLLVMIDLPYLKTTLTPLGYQLNTDSETPIFWKRIRHDNARSIYAFSLIIITLDKFTITVEGLNELLINRAINSGVLVINEPEELDALRHIAYDYTLDELPRFETIFTFFEQQLHTLQTASLKSDEQNACLKNIKTIVEAANAVVL